MEKCASDMYPLSELRMEFAHRIRTTGFSNYRPSVIVNFKLMSNIVSKIEGASKKYAEVIDKALSKLAFYTKGDRHELDEVEYMFFDENRMLVAVLHNGDLYTVMDSDNAIQGDSPDDVIVSTSELKEYYLEHRLDFPNLNELTKVIDAMGAHSNVNKMITLCPDNAWVRENLNDCIEEMDRLLSNASFVIKQAPKKLHSTIL